LKNGFWPISKSIKNRQPFTGSGLPWRDCFVYAWVTLIDVNFEIKAFTFDPGLGQGFNVQG
jgi:hypothetical protein